MDRVKVGIIGGTGYTSMELLRLLINHPLTEVVCITSVSESGNLISNVFPSLRRYYNLYFSDCDTANLDKCDVVFFTTSDGVSMHHAPVLLDKNIKVIDLSADFRIKDVTIWEEWYGMKHISPNLIRKAVYGLPEMNRNDIKSASLVANPGCYPTAVQLGFLALLENNLVDTSSLIADVKSGVSGAGRKPMLGTAFTEVSESFKAYSVSSHKHLPEIKQGLQEQTKAHVEILFTPHLVPMIRGIHATLYARLNDSNLDLSNQEIQTIHEKKFKTEPFVNVMPFSSHPDTRSVKGSNECSIAIHRPQCGNTIVVLVVEDNLGKGASGQAIQNMNLMFGIDESIGLEFCPLMP